MAAAREAVELEPRRPQYRSNLGGLLLRQGDLVAAEQEQRAAIELNPVVAPLHEQLARILARQGRMDEAILAARQAMECSGGNAQRARCLETS